MLIFTLASLLAQPAPCVHDMTSPRPRVTLAEQAETRRTIRIAVDQLGGSPDFAALLLLVAARESSSQRGLVHRLQADLDATAKSWRKLAKIYASNQHAADPARWQAYGLFGMNSPIFTMIWDPQADPTVLCDPLVDVMVYQRAAARVVAKLQRTGRCAPTWATVHAAVSGGKLCPVKISADFRRRAARAGIDPDARVSLASLGRMSTRADQIGVLVRLRFAVNKAAHGAS